MIESRTMLIAAVAVTLAAVAFGAEPKEGETVHFQDRDVYVHAPNYDKAKIPPYTLEDPLTFLDGRRVTKENWNARRKEILGIFAREMYGAEPPPPKDIKSADELFITAEHLDQYRHPTRYPEAYLDELLRRDPLDSRAHVLYAKRLLQRGHFASARQLLAKNGDHAMSRCALAWLDLREKGRVGGRLRPERKFFFLSRPRDYVILRDLDAATGERNAALAYALGNYCYDRKRHEEALRYWQRATRLDPKFPTAWRNLGVALWNVRRDAKGAQAAYAKAIACDPKDARLVAEASILAEKCGVDSSLRLKFLLDHEDLVLSRDDATVELVSLYNETGSPEKALDLMRSHRFHPWEGGEGKVLLQWARANAMLKRWTSLFNPPQNLGETFHLVPDDPELKCYKAYALKAEGRTAEAKRILADVRKFVLATRRKPAKIDYFATSLPLVLIFEDDLEAVKNRQMERLLRLARLS